MHWWITYDLDFLTCATAIYQHCAQNYSMIIKRIECKKIRCKVCLKCKTQHWWKEFQKADYFHLVCGFTGKFEPNFDLWKVVSLYVGGRDVNLGWHEYMTLRRGRFLPTFDIYLVLLKIRLNSFWIHIWPCPWV